MNVLEVLEQEVAFEPAVRALVRSVNLRLGSRSTSGEFWVRLRPPTLHELELGSRRPSLVKFHRVASLVQILKVLPDHVEVSCAGSTALFEIPDFLETYVKVNYWPGRQSSNPPAPPSEETP